MKANTRSLFFYLMLIMVTALSCKKENVISGNLSAEQKWILDSMRVYYYWNETLPKNPSENNSSTSFFKSLLNSADRFSYLDDPDEVKTEYSSFGYYGFDYALLSNAAAPGGLIATVTLVVPGSAAYKAGLKRGDFFTAVNDIIINNASSSNVQHVLKQGNPIKLQLANLSAGIFTNAGILNLSALYFTEQPVYITKTFNSAGKKTGYIFYDAFNGVFDRNMLDSLTKLEAAGISNLIIDLRYNPGGDVSSAAKIAGALTAADANQIFVIYQANKNGGRSNRTFQQTMLENDYQPQSFSEIKSRRLSLQKVIILTTAATASSAELLINTLKPYASVIQIGQTTIGKDMASFAIADGRKPASVNLVLHPLVFKLYNANGTGDYSKGLAPDYEADEFAGLPLKQFGDPADPLLNQALKLTGNLTTASVTKNKTTPNLAANTTIAYHSARERAAYAASVNVRHVIR
ncbi:S41 family peptidase [Mucilaginibacter angelicae]|uniref:S41 family peptidase n=1 Tax=Mucilaginibacter angelicae TaxID=869718 RepID=A0ABV6LA75_9SPHI